MATRTRFFNLYCNILAQQVKVHSYLGVDLLAIEGGRGLFWINVLQTYLQQNIHASDHCPPPHPPQKKKKITQVQSAPQKSRYTEKN